MTERLDDKIDKMFMLREQKRGLENQIKEVNAEIADISDWLLDRCDDVGTTTAKGSLASIVVTESVVPRVEDWDAVADYVIDNDAIYLLHRRVSSGPWRELLDTGETVPGITPFTKRAISLTKLRD